MGVLASPRQRRNTGHSLTQWPSLVPKPLILLTRPEAAARRFARRYLMAHDVMIAPVMEIVAEGPAPTLDGVTDLIITSQNALAQLETARVPPGITAWCVGPQTARRAAELGFEPGPGGGGPGTAEGLISRIRTHGVGRRFLYLRGDVSRGNIAQTLLADGIEVTERIVYHQVARPLTPEARAQLISPRAVVLPVFSQRSAEHLAPCLADAKDLLCILISAQIKVAELHRAARQVQTAARPTAGAMAIAVTSAARLLESGVWPD